MVFNIDETGVNTEHLPLKIVFKKNTGPQNITSSRAAPVTGIATGNAAGPYDEMPDLLVGFYHIFNYFTEHFLQCVTTHGSEDPSLILYEGHRYHISLTLTEWA